MFRRNPSNLLLTLLAQLFEGPAPFAWYQKKGLVMLYISCSTTGQEVLTSFVLSVQVSFRGRTCNSLKGPYRNKMKVVYCSERAINNFDSMMLFKIFVVSRNYRLKICGLAAWNPNYATYDLNYGVTIVKL